jgi:hypothetical protein
MRGSGAGTAATLVFASGIDPEAIRIRARTRGVILDP